VPHEKLFQEVVTQELGYAYLSNESETPSEAYFDDFTVTVSESSIVQLVDYYPYGMIAGSWVRTGEKTTRELFQGKTYEEVVALSHFGARQYDASLGRWQGVDPANQFASPYTGMGNNPVLGVDPDGRAIPFLAVVAIGAAVGGGLNVWQNAKHINNAGDFFKFFGWGAAVGAGSIVGGAAFAPVIGTGAIAGATIGSVSGATLTAGNIALGGGNGEKAGKQILSAFVWGGIGGGVISGTMAAIGGRNFFTGAKLNTPPGQQFGEPTWKFKDTEKIKTQEFWKFVRNLPPGRVEPGKPSYSPKQEPGEWDLAYTKKLYRGTTGNESMDRLLYFADDPEYAVGYIRNGGTLFEYKMPYSEFQKHIWNGAIEQLKGINASTGQYGVEYLIKDPKLKQDILNQLFNLGR
jgi:RHS repeat-associated protein